MKKNEAEFPRAIDCFVEIENKKGEKVVVSFGEIFYPEQLNRIIIAKSVSLILPSKIDTVWEIPKSPKMVFADDLINVRNIENPVKITIKSAPVSYEVNQGMNPMYSETFMLKDGEKMLYTPVDALPAGLLPLEYSTVFYGRGKGIHGISTFTGFAVKGLLSSYFPKSRERLMKGYYVVSAKDGYRTVFTYNEVHNRSDYQELLIYQRNAGDHGGLFCVFPAMDFFLTAR
jgi:hypothetical protein